jgi:pSer/pThr/pTyr-binding forkhead associated (FHA) protein
LLQEFDLPPGDTLIGRGPDCRITLVDPLVSRHHARIRIGTELAMLEDMGSRNGSRVNGRLIRAPHVLSDGDRVRIGTQELTFSEIDRVPLGTNKPTGFFYHCAKCRLPYPEEDGVCPNCGSTSVQEESTLSGILDDRTRQSWALQMLIDMLRKALSLGRESDADRIMHQAVQSLDGLRPSVTIDDDQMEALSLEALKLSGVQKDLSWAKWVLEAYHRTARVPPPSVADGVSGLPRTSLPGLVNQLDALLDGAPGNKLSPAEAEGLARLRSLRASLQG